VDLLSCRLQPFPLFLDNAEKASRTIVKMIFAYAQAQSQRKFQYIVKSAKIDAKKKKGLTVV
jgi:hypothetical protein